MGVLDRRFLVCLALLVVNDRVLKAEFSNWVTGKLSDVVGVVVFAVVVGQALRWLGVSRRWSMWSGIAVSGMSLAAVKLHAGAAGAVEAATALVGVPWQIVVDPTDLLALLALPLAGSIMSSTLPVDIPRDCGGRFGVMSSTLPVDIIKRIVFVGACLACAASGTEDSAAYDFVEHIDDGTIVVGQRDFAGEHSDVSLVLATASPTRWETDPDIDGITWTLTRESCSPVEPQTCIQLGPNSRVSVSTDGGESFSRAWEVDDGGFWRPDGPSPTPVGVGSPRLYTATDIAWTNNGDAFIAMSDRYPIIRRADGRFVPSIADLHPFPWPTAIYVLVAWFIAGAALRIASERESRRGMIPLGLAALAFLLGGPLFGAAEGFGGLVSFMMVPVALVLLVLGVIRAITATEADFQPNRFATVPVLKLLAPFLPLLLLAYAWDIDLLGWWTMSALMLALFAAATVWAWPFLPIPPPSAPTTYSDQPT